MYYYILLLFGSVSVSWVIWSRFLRERVVRDIPDPFLTEYRFWILFYISVIYFYSAKNFFRPIKKNTIFSEILVEITRIFYLPLEKLDHIIKYHSLKDNFYRKLLYSFIMKLRKISCNYLALIIFLLEILPRIILICFLVFDTFYFHRLEIFYKVILLGLLPFSYRYVIYSLKNHYEYLVMLLLNYYDIVQIDRIDDDDDEKRKYYLEQYGLYSVWGEMKRTEEKRKDSNYKKCISMKEYIDLKYQNHFDYFFKDVGYQYIGHAYVKDEVDAEYLLKKYGDSDRTSSCEDLEQMSQLFKESIPEIIEIRAFLEKDLAYIKDWKILIWSKIIIFTLYGICWSFILIISYCHYPVEFNMFQYLINNIALYLLLPENPFLMVDSYSRNVNLITLESVTSLIRTIWRRINFLK